MGKWRWARSPRLPVQTLACKSWSVVLLIVGTRPHENQCIWSQVPTLWLGSSAVLRVWSRVSSLPAIVKWGNPVLGMRDRRIYPCLGRTAWRTLHLRGQTLLPKAFLACSENWPSCILCRTSNYLPRLLEDFRVPFFWPLLPGKS